MCGDVIGSAVSLIESGMTCEMGPWECLIGIVLVVIIEEGRPAYCGWGHSLSGILD